MSLGLQIAMGLVPVFLLCLMLSIFSKRRRLKNILFSVIFFGAMLATGIPALMPAVSRIVPASSGNVLRMSYAAAKEGNAELAAALLGSMRQAYTTAQTLCHARIAALRGDFAGAYALYRKVTDEYPEAAEEYAAVRAAADAARAVLFADTPEARRSSQEEQIQAQEALATQLDTRFAEEAAGEGTDMYPYSETAQILVYADEAHHALLRGDTPDKARVTESAERLETLIRQYPELETVEEVRLARLKLNLLAERYDQIAKNIDDASDYHELLIASELYLSRYIGRQDFSPEYAAEKARRYEAVYERLNEIYMREYGERPRDERNAALAQLKAMEERIANPVLAEMEDGLLAYAATENAQDASKAYMQAAKIEHATGDGAQASVYIDRSLDTVGDCEDDGYTMPMYELIDIIGDKDNPDRLMDAARYVDEALENNLTVKPGNLIAEPSAQEAQTEGYGEQPDAQEEQQTLSEDFSGALETYVSQKRMSVKIVGIDTSLFEDEKKVIATVNVGNNQYTDAEALREAMRVIDCGVEIESFTVERVEYTKANILLCVDVSGSMEGAKIEMLKDAIRQFAAGTEEIESTALISFSGYIIDDYGFGTNMDTLMAAADGMGPIWEGTDMYHAMIESASRFTPGEGVINSIILMSDGQDINPVSFAEIDEYVGAPCRSKGVTVYSIGFGEDVDAAYLSYFATCTGGAYLFASEPAEGGRSNQLQEFFEGLRAQIRNQYRVTFQVADEVRYERELQIEIGESRDSDRATYYLGGGAESMSASAYDENSPFLMADKGLTGFVPMRVYKNGDTMRVQLRGANFKKEDAVRVALKGCDTGVEFTTGVSYVDETTLSVELPAGIAIDSYDAYVRINGKEAVLPRALSVAVQGMEKYTRFGRYTFTSDHKQESVIGGVPHATLTGNVTMNGWLHFKGAIDLQGDLEGTQILMIDPSGAQVHYEVMNSTGLACTLASEGRPVNIPAFQAIALFNESGNAQLIETPFAELTPLTAASVQMGTFLTVPVSETRLYPDYVEYSAETLKANLPFAKQLLKQADLFTFEAEVALSIGSTAVDCKVAASAGANKTSQGIFRQVSFGNSPLYLSPGSASFSIDTRKNEYSVDFSVNLPFMNVPIENNMQRGGLSLSIAWDGPDRGDALGQHDNGIVPVKIMLGADVDINGTLAGVPVTWSDFTLGLDNIDTSKSPLYWTLVGGFDLSALKISAYEPFKGMKDWIGDVSIFKLDDVRLSLTLGECNFLAEGQFKLLEGIDVGSIELEIGKMYYNSRVLNMDNELAWGMRAEIRKSIDWEFGVSRLNFDGSFQVALTNRFCGFEGSLEFEVVFKAWIVSISTGRQQGEGSIGIRFLPDGSAAFVIRTGPSWNANITWPKNMAGKV